jgi:hypothetical protein
MPNIDDIIYFDGVNSLKVERWRIEFFQEEIFKGLEQAMTGVDIEREPHALFNTMLSIVRTPLFWDSYYTDEERRILEGEMISPFSRECYHEDKERPFVPSILIYEHRKDEQTIRFRRYPITKVNSLPQVLSQILEMLKERDEQDGQNFAREMELVPESDKCDIEAALAEARNAINRLRKLGVDEFTIKQLLACNEQPYELHILNNGRFFAIPRFKNVEKQSEPTEIRLSPLEKAVYLLFLHHPEGIMFSYLPDHREELMRYYRQLMNYRTNQQMIKSVSDVTDPTMNSINEKCARIRRMFIDAIGEENADNYCVTGTRNTPKGIRLDRSLVHCQIQ